MRQPGQPGRTTAVVGVLLALLLAGGTWIASSTDGPPQVEPVPAPATTDPAPTVAQQTIRSGPPRQGKAYPVRRLGALDGRSVIASGRGNADLRYRRAAGNGTRLHFICTGCDSDTWLVEWPRGSAVGGGPLTSPADTIWALDTADLGPATSLLVRAPARSDWSVALTPFDDVPLHEQSFDALDDDVVAVRARGDVRVRCPGALFTRTLARPPGAAEYEVGQLQQQDTAGTYTVTAPAGTDEMILMVGCPGRWTLTLP